MHRIEHYETPDGSDPIQEWLGKLRDNRARATVLRRLDRLAAGNFGDHVFCRDGVWELRIDLRSTRRASVMGTRSHEAATIESFRDDPQFAAEYLNQVLEDGDQDELMVALRRMAAAFGGVGGIAEAADLNATTLYRTLSQRGNPELKSLTAILKAMGLRIAVQPL